MHNFPKGIDVVCTHKHNLKEAKEIFHLCIDNDVNIYHKTFQDPVNDKYENFVFDNYEGLSQIQFNNKKDNNHLYVSFEEFKAFIQGKGKYNPSFKEELKLNDIYLAVITKQNIMVGCQEFSHETIKKLYQLSQKALKS